MNRNTQIIAYAFLYVSTLWLGISSALLFLPIVVYFFLKYGILKPVANLLLPLLIPVIGSCLIGLVEYSYYDVFKDFLYMSLPIIGILTGYYLEQKYDYRQTLSNFEKICKILVIAFIAFQLIRYGLDSILKAREIREERKLMFNIGTLPIVIAGILLYRTYNPTIKKKKDMAWIILIFLSILMTGSRTDLMSLIIMGIALLLPLIKTQKKKLFKYISIIVCITIVYIATAPQYTLKTLERSLNEVSISNKAHLNKHENYRGYEAKKALNTIDKFSAFHKVMGGGLGTKAHIGVDGPIMTDVPITHNGYVYILLKSGIWGMLLYLIWGIVSLKIFLKWKTYTPDESCLKYIAIGSLLVLYFINYVIWGLFNISGIIFFIIIGIAYSKIYSTNTSNNT